MKPRAAQADVQSGAPTFEELPMPPAMAALVQRSGRWELPAVAVAAALLGAAAYAGGRTRSGEASIFPACLALLILLAVWLNWRGRQKALRSRRFVRARGRFQALDITHAEGGSWEFRAGPRRFSIDEAEWRAIAPIIDQAAAADFSEPAEILFELRDSEGKVLWRHPHYKGDDVSG
jgi:hypothetical protein